MNILVDELPEDVEINGSTYLLVTDFRNCIKILLAFEDNELTGYEKQLVLVTRLYKEIPEDIGAAVEKGMWFLDCGSERSEEEVTGHRLYSFSKDAGFIFAAFRQTHGIDLETAQLHWWKFITLFMDLGPDTTFNSLVSLRKKLVTGKATKEEKEAARDMGDVLEVPELDTRTLEERELEAQFMAQLGKAT
jgi:hypothetical protein